MNETVLCFVKSVGTDIEGNNLYEFLFTEEPDTFWGDGFENMPASLRSGLTPMEGSYSIVRTVKTSLKLCLATESCCHSMQDCIDGVIALAYEDISTYDEYPDEGRLVLHFGNTYDEVELKLIKRDMRLLDNKMEHNDEEEFDY